MIEVHLYGKLRRFCPDRAANADSILRIPRIPGDKVSSVVARIGIPTEALGSNLFVNGTYADLESSVPEGARLGLFPDDMQLLYKWYFNPEKAKAEKSED
jgi:hypothetical protein